MKLDNYNVNCEEAIFLGCVYGYRHYKAAKESSSLVSKIGHRVIGTLEYIPVAGSIIALIELVVAKVFTMITSLFQSKARPIQSDSEEDSDSASSSDGSDFELQQPAAPPLAITAISNASNANITESVTQGSSTPKPATQLKKTPPKVSQEKRISQVPLEPSPAIQSPETAKNSYKTALIAAGISAIAATAIVGFGYYLKQSDEVQDSNAHALVALSQGTSSEDSLPEQVVNFAYGQMENIRHYLQIAMRKMTLEFAAQLKPLSDKVFSQVANAANPLLLASNQTQDPVEVETELSNYTLPYVEQMVAFARENMTSIQNYFQNSTRQVTQESTEMVSPAFVNCSTSIESLAVNHTQTEKTEEANSASVSPLHLLALNTLGSIGFAVSKKLSSISIQALKALPEKITSGYLARAYPTENNNRRIRKSQVNDAKNQKEGSIGYKRQQELASKRNFHGNMLTFAKTCAYGFITLPALMTGFQLGRYLESE